MSRDEEYRKRAEAYLKIHHDHEQARKMHQKSADRVNEVKRELDEAGKALNQFVGPNQPVRNHVIDGMLVRVEYKSVGDGYKPVVSVESLA